MRGISGIIKFAVFLAVIVGIGIGIGWLATRPKSTDSDQANSFAQGADAQRSSPAINAAPTARPVILPVNANPDEDTDSKGMVTNWEDRIGDVLASDSSISNKCNSLFELFPRLPEAGQVEAAHHLSNLVGNDNYDPLGKILTNPTTSSNVDDVLMLDVLNRPGTIKLPTLLQIARTPNHPEAADARSKLTLYLEDDFGDDWFKWQAKIDDYLTNNPD
jgi:hypothetical protein